ncbi:MAG: YCF48-related protein [Flavobacteriales bacterium]
MRINILLLLFILPLSLCCQWNKINVSTTRHLNAVAFPSATTVFIVGDSGTILKSTNTGTSFGSVNSGTAKNLKDIVFTGTTGVAVGSSGTILLSTNSGNSWNSITSPTVNDLNAVAFFNASNGIIVGNNGTILKTSNGGTSWTNITPITIYLLNKVLYLSANEVVACGAHGTVMKSTNGGNDWSIVNASTNRYLSDLISYNDSLLFVGDKGVELEANEALTSFVKDSLCIDQLRSVYCSGKNCISVGKNAMILARENDDKWIAVASGQTKNYNDIRFINDTTAFIVGDSGIVLKTITGGISNAVHETEEIQIGIYPNPSSGDFYLSLGTLQKDPTQVSIINNLGATVYQQTFASGENVFFISKNLPLGFYLLNVQSGGNNGTRKLVIR